MRLSPLVLALIVAGMSGQHLEAKRSGNAQAKYRKHKVSQAHHVPSSKKMRRHASDTKVIKRRRKLHEEDYVASDLDPMPNLPTTPAVSPKMLVHLEKILPSTLVDWSPKDLVPAAQLETHTFGSHMLQPVLPKQATGVAPPASELSHPSSAPLLADPDNLDLLWPVGTRTVSSGFGPRIRTKTMITRVKSRSHRLKRVKVPYRGRHKGIDLTCPLGGDVCAAMEGEVVDCGCCCGYGNFVVLDHGNGVTTLYAHNKLNYVGVGDVVRRGQKIAEVGMTGRTSGPHLHFEVRVNGIHRDPFPVLNDTEEIPAEILAQNQAAVPPR